jgi:hypothetical protein
MILSGAFGLWKSSRLFAVASRVQQIPVTTIASADAGAVRLRGRVRCDDPVSSPFSKTQCCYYRAEVEHEHSGEVGVANWNPIHHQSSTVDFILSDGTGEVPVCPEGLEFDGNVTYQHDVIAQPNDARDQLLLDYVTQNCPRPARNWVLNKVEQAFIRPDKELDPRARERLRALEARYTKHSQRKTQGHSYRFREFCVLPGQECEISGTLEHGGGRKQLSKGSGSTPFLLNTNGNRDLVRIQKKRAYGFAAISGSLVLAGVFFLIFNQ